MSHYDAGQEIIEWLSTQTIRHGCGIVKAIEELHIPKKHYDDIWESRECDKRFQTNWEPEELYIVFFGKRIPIVGFRDRLGISAVLHYSYTYDPCSRYREDA